MVQRGALISESATPAPAPQRAAIGLRAHSGWAALVAVAGSLRSPAVVERRRIVLADASVAGSKQPYHAAEKLPFDAAEQFVAQCRECSARLAGEAVGAALDDLAGRGYRVVSVGLLLAGGRPLPGLAAVLASHALIHTAEGELFREVLALAGERRGLAVLKVKERELDGQCESALGVPAAELPGLLAAIGKTLGPPWRQDEKYAALAGWLALVSHREKRAAHIAGDRDAIRGARGTL
jgi:hypothetical protein